jgi:hypothetical protein
MRFLPHLLIGISPITSGSLSVPCSNYNSNSNSISNITSIENTGLVNGSFITEGAMSLEL